MLSHATAHDWLIPYADGMLAADERNRVNGHIMGCGACRDELRQVRELNLLLVSLPPAPPVAFAPFWLKLQAVLPQRRMLRIPSLAGYRRAGLALALAGLTAIVISATALAAPGAMPDNPIYPVKQLEETLQLAITPVAGILTVQLQHANERLREALVMSNDHKPLLAAQSLRAFRVTVDEAAAALKKADPRVARPQEDRLRAGLAAVERANALKNDDDPDVRQLVAASVGDLDRIEPVLKTTPTPAPIASAQATPTPAPTSKPAPKPTPKPQPSDNDRRRP